MAKDLTTMPQTKIATKPNPNLAEEIRRRAYELYEARGREEGHETEDWLRAEEEITGTHEYSAGGLSRYKLH